MEGLLGSKELYDVVLKSTYPIEINGQTIEPGEVIAMFDKILIGNFNEIKTHFSANGGYDNRGLVFWDNTKEVKIDFVQGIFSKTQLSLLSNAKLIKGQDEGVIISKREQLSLDENNSFTLKEKPLDKLFVYNKVTGEKLQYTNLSDKTYQVEGIVSEVVADYTYEYFQKYSTMNVGERLVEGFLSLEGKTRLKDDTTGQVVTGIIKIPKLKLMSDLSMRLGRDATPMVATFSATGLPEGAKGNKKVMEIIFLSDDIDADM